MFQALRSRRFQRVFDRVNLHRLTLTQLGPPATPGNSFWMGAPRVYALYQGLTLVHFAAQLEPCLTQENTLHTLNTPSTRDAQPLRAPRIPCKALKLS